MYFIAASPLVKIFLPEWHDRLQANPDLIYDTETPFEFTVSTGTRGIRVKFMTPMQVHGPDEKQNAAMYKWLTGGATGSESRDTDIYGIVKFDPKIDMVSMFDELAMLDDDPSKAKDAAAKRKAAKDAMKSTHEQARKASDIRIIRALKFNHNNLMKQWQTNEEMKLGKHKPSISETIGMYALRQEIEAKESKSKDLHERVSKLMTGTMGA